MLPSCDNSWTFILPRKYVPPKLPCLFIALHDDVRVIWGPYCEDYGDGHLTGCTVLYAGRKVPMAEKFYRTAGFPEASVSCKTLSDISNAITSAPIWTQSVRLGQIFPRLRHCSHASKIPSTPHTGKADRQSQLKMFIIYIQLCYMFRPEQTVVR